MNIAIVEDHRMLAEALSNSLKGRPGIGEIRFFSGGENFLGSQREWHPDLIISDLLMPGISGVGLIKAYRKQLGEHIKIIVLSSVSRKNDVEEVMLGGANCFISKEEPIEALIRAIHKVIEGECYISESLLGQFNNRPKEQVNGFRLSPRESDVLNLICSGRIMKEVANDLNLSVHTVQSYHNNVMRKFNVRRTSDLIIAAIKHGLYVP
jgi:DNA-binding NarL/FixJ family response regulator